jgi:hypothetical protein
VPARQKAFAILLLVAVLHSGLSVQWRFGRAVIATAHDILMSGFIAGRGSK